MTTAANEHQTAEGQESETLKAVSARARRALDLLEAGDHEKAKTQLRVLVRILPTPEMRHVLACQDRR